MSKKEAFRSLTKNDILKPYTSDHDFRSTNVDDAGEEDDSAGYTLYVFDTRYQKNLGPIKNEFKISEDNPAGIYGYALVLMNKLVSTSSDGQRHFDLI